jgi:hypothetical protein
MDQSGSEILSRRTALQLMAGVPTLGASLRRAGSPPGEEDWTGEWDRALIAAALARSDRSFDPAETMIRRRVGSAYNYHSSLREMDVHPTRESLEYALVLLESDEAERRELAFKTIERLTALQVVDPASRWYGLWGYYLEEPPEKMSPADWNWADFNGSTLLLILHRHGGRLPGRLRELVVGSLRHAAASIRRRNVSMAYTNIAAMGTFVSFSAAEVLEDPQLLGYASDRVRRFAESIDETGSFGEYNSPTYASVTLAQLTCFRMFVKDPGAKTVMEAIHRRLWLHLANHWHVPTRQLAGPMSRCYATVFTERLWIQKSLNNAMRFLTLDDLRSGRPGGEARVGMLEWKCPDNLRDRFLKLDKPKQHREIFFLGLSPWEASGPPSRPVQGTTYVTPRFCLGSINRGDFWVQRRPLLAYWGEPASPSYLQLRLVKDDYDFASGLFYSVQNENFVLAAAGFRNDGGDKHLSLDPIKDGTFSARRLYLQFLVSGCKESQVLLDGQPVKGEIESLPMESARRVAVRAGQALIVFVPRMAVFGNEKPTLSIHPVAPVSDNVAHALSIEIDLFRRKTPEVLRWSEVRSGFVGFGLALRAPGDLLAFDRAVAACSWKVQEESSTVVLEWRSTAGELGLKASRAIEKATSQNLLFEEKLNGRSVPLVRLSEERLAPSS